MGKLIFSNENNESKIVNFDDNYRFVWDFTGNNDLDFINSKYETKEFENLYNELRTIDLFKYPNFNFEINGKKFPYTAKVKEILYRIVGYNGGGVDFEIRELLTFKFLPQNNYDIGDDDIVYCNKDCQYYKTRFCTKYNSYLRELNKKSTVCKMCFLEIATPIYRTLRNMHYNQVFPK